MDNMDDSCCEDGGIDEFLQELSSTTSTMRALHLDESHPRSDDLIAMLVVEGVSLFVDKEVLCTYTQFFHDLFTKLTFAGCSDSSEPDTDGVVVPGVKYDEFTHFLSFFFPGDRSVTRDSVAYLMALAHRFDCPLVMNKCAQFLIATSDVSVVKKLMLADEYRRPDIEEHCLAEIDTFDVFIEKVLLDPATKTVNDRLKAVFVEKAATLLHHFDPISYCE